jgi:DNA-binding MarR family transcriptional regulator
MRPRISGDGAAMTLVRPGPSPAPLVADEMRAPSLSAASYVPGRFEELGSNTGFLLALLGQEAMRRLRDALTDHDLKPRQFQILDLLADRGPIGQRELGEIMAIDHSILVTMLNPLEADGLIERKRSGTDRRRHVVSVTPAGKRRLATATQAQREAENALFAGLTDQQRDQLRSLLIALRDSSHTEPAADDDC